MIGSRDLNVLMYLYAADRDDVDNGAFTEALRWMLRRVDGDKASAADAKRIERYLKSPDTGEDRDADLPPAIRHATFRQLVRRLEWRDPDPGMLDELLELSSDEYSFRQVGTARQDVRPWRGFSSWLRGILHGAEHASRSADVDSWRFTLFRTVVDEIERIELAGADFDLLDGKERVERFKAALRREPYAHSPMGLEIAGLLAVPRQENSARAKALGFGLGVTALLWQIALIEALFFDRAPGSNQPSIMPAETGTGAWSGGEAWIAMLRGLAEQASPDAPPKGRRGRPPKYKPLADFLCMAREDGGDAEWIAKRLSSLDRGKSPLRFSDVNFLWTSAEAACRIAVADSGWPDSALEERLFEILFLGHVAGFLGHLERMVDRPEVLERVPDVLTVLHHAWEDWPRLARHARERFGELKAAAQQEARGLRQDA
ncbi:hypothetical protein EV216_13427 [Rhodovulum steppense]|uniref:Uncharacterized protein n=2 Tax=Rhodovulum steppense TaxID=540251 RepID=A0A4R1YJA4_9RHOB|nr:hypothetical protein EV216_13427 [Rhodovulum steppense]